MIKNWNETVSKNDIVFELGDMFPFCKYEEAKTIIDQLNGKIISLKGNHFNNEFPRLFPKITYHDLLDIQVIDPEVSDGKQRITLCHYPFAMWNHQHKGSWMIHGHSHATIYPEAKNQLHVGVDDHAFYPLSYEDVKIVITTKNLKQ